MCVAHIFIHISILVNNSLSSDLGWDDAVITNTYTFLLWIFNEKFSTRIVSQNWNAMRWIWVADCIASAHNFLLFTRAVESKFNWKCCWEISRMFIFNFHLLFLEGFVNFENCKFCRFNEANWKKKHRLNQKNYIFFISLYIQKFLDLNFLAQLFLIDEFWNFNRFKWFSISWLEKFFAWISCFMNSLLKKDYDCIALQLK